MPKNGMDWYNGVPTAFSRDKDGDYHEVLNSWCWLPGWSKRMFSNHIVALDVPLVLSAVFVTLACVRRKRQRYYLSAALFLTPALLGIAFWFLKAPAMRFAGPLFWWLVAGTLWLTSDSSDPSNGHAALRRGFCLAMLFVSAVFFLKRDIFVGPDPSGNSYALPEPELEVFTTDSGLEIFVPKLNDQVWDAPLPSAPYRDPAISMRNPPHLRDGFRYGEK